MGLDRRMHRKSKNPVKAMDYRVKPGNDDLARLSVASTFGAA
jgi:hypothetical protein